MDLLLLLVLAAADVRAQEKSQTDRDYEASQFVSAAARGDADVVEEFLGEGMDPNVRDYVGKTALAAATGSGETEIAMRLLDAGADPNAPDGEGRTPLMIAAHWGWLENVQWAREGFPELRDALIEKGADVNARDAKGVTALVEAAGAGDAPTVRALLARGADPKRAADDGTTPLSAAARAHYGEIVQALVEAGAPTSLWQRIQHHAFRFVKLEAWLGPPIVLACIVLAFIERKRPVRPKRHAVEHGDELPRLAPLKCRKCAAPVPIVPTDLRCPSCGTDVVVPPDYAGTLARREEASRGLRSAVWAWRRAQVVTSPPVVWLMWIAGPTLFVATIVGVVGIFGTRNLPGAIVGSAIVMAITFGLTIFCTGFFLRGSRRRIPVVPKIGASVGEDETGNCSLCGAPVAFAAGELATGCAYCGGEIYRVALARRAHAVAAADASRVAISIYDTMIELQERRRQALGVLVGTFGAIFAFLVVILWTAIQEAI